MSSTAGYTGKATNGRNKIAEMGKWSNPGAANDLLDDSQLGDENKSFEYGPKDGGTIQFDGSFDPTDTDGQEALRTAYENKTTLDEIRLYYGSGDADFFYVEDGTECLVESCNIDVDKSGIGHISFVLKLSGGFLKKAAAASMGTTSFADTDPDSITRASGSFVTDGFVAEQSLTVQGSDSNDGTYTIASVAALTITLDGADVLTGETSTTNVTLIAS